MSKASRLKRTKLGTTNHNRMSDAEKLFLSQQPFLQTYYNHRAPMIVEAMKEKHGDVRVKIAVIPTWNEKIYNVVTEVIPVNASSQADIFRITKYIRFADLLRSLEIMAEEDAKEEPDTDRVAAVLPERLAESFVTVVHTGEDGKPVEVQLRQETAYALNYTESCNEAIRTRYQQLLDAEKTKIRLTGHHARPFYVRAHYDPAVSEDVVFLTREGIDGTPTMVETIGTYGSYGVENPVDVKTLHIAYQSEIKRFAQSSFDNAYPWKLIDMGIRVPETH